MGEHVPETVPVNPEETRGGEQPGDWKIAGDAAANAAAIQAQLAVTSDYIKHTYGGDIGDGETE